MSSKDLKKGTKKRGKERKLPEDFAQVVEDYSLAWLWVLSPKKACKQNGHLVLYETVTFLVELPGPVKNRELRQP